MTDAPAPAPAHEGTARDAAAREGGAVPRSRRWLPWVALLWLLLPATDIIGSDTGVPRVLSLAALAAFGTAFLWVATTMSSADSAAPTRTTWLCTVVITVLTVLMPLLRRDVEWTCLQVYCAVTLAFVLPLQHVARGIAASVVLAAVQSMARGNVTQETLGTALTVFGLSMTMLGLRRSRVLVRRLHDAQGEVARLAAVEERLRIARDLHDLVGHSLSLIVVKSELAGRLAEADLPAAAREIADVESVARQSLVEVRDAVTGYRQRSLVEELDDARSALAAAEVAAVLRPPGAPLPGEIDQLFGWAVREGVTNVIRHASASRCEITVRGDARSARLDVVDDGRGPGPLERDGDGNGLAGLAERVAAAHGTVTTGPAARGGRGFRLTVRVPVPAAAGDAAAGGPPSAEAGSRAGAGT
ncbi:hypothetical protein GCM10018793_68110 [Streptomyces sulfonofaciens]|uniref:Sensor histidine kinase n=1 Tax=Streptomyces sulfonofaciens TaxID=68272 RepID=A0A919L914_9ACTN|nr:sensor histidine kinase [Streptomyces sulfonofaciens]GHH88438.1 hypothetical protein GCM10018793_68110 [Streptomyces sulfonofaciens]